MMKETEQHVYQHGWLSEVELENERGATASLPLVPIEMKQATPFERWLLENYTKLPEYWAIQKRFEVQAQLYTEQNNTPYYTTKLVINERSIE